MADAADKPTEPIDAGSELESLRAQLDTEVSAELDAATDSPTTQDESAPDQATPARAGHEESGQDAIDSVDQVSGDLDELTAAIDELLQANPGTPPGSSTTDEAPPAEAIAADTAESAALEEEIGELTESVEDLLAEAADAALGAGAPGEDLTDLPSADPIAEPADTIDEPARDAPGHDETVIAEPADTATDALEGALGGADTDDSPDSERVAEPADHAPSAPVITEPPAAASPAIEPDELDAELAAVSDALMEQDRIEPEVIEAPHPLGEEPPEPADDEDPQAEDADPDAYGAEQPVSADEAPLAESEPDEPAPEVSAPSPQPAPASEFAEAPVAAGAETLPERVRAVAVQVWARLAPLAGLAAPHAATLVLALSKPLESRPARLRQTLGWLAIYSAFMCACVWVYIAVIRQAPAPMNDARPAGVVTPDGPANAASARVGSVED